MGYRGVSSGMVVSVDPGPSHPLQVLFAQCTGVCGLGAHKQPGRAPRRREGVHIKTGAWGGWEDNKDMPDKGAI